METITLGQNGPAVTPLCIGTWAWGDKIFWNYGKDYGSDQVKEAFKVALEAGITFFDTAEIYGFGLSEELLGQFMHQNNRPVQIATKFGPAPWRFTAESVSDALTGSLKRLQVERVALYQVHWPFSFFMSQQTLMNALADEVKRGRIEAVGRLAVNQVRYSLLSRQIESNGILQTAHQLGVTILAYSPLAQGLLTGKYLPDSSETPNDTRRIDPRFSKDGLKKIEPVITLLRQLGEKHGHTPAQVALNWLIAQGGVIPIAGAKTAEQVRQNAGALGWRLSDEEVAQVDQVSRPWLQ